MEIIYEPHPVTPERKAELRAKGYRIIDARFKPANTHSNAHLDKPESNTEPAATDKQAMLDTLAERGVHKDMRSSVSTLRRLIAETEDQDDAD